VEAWLNRLLCLDAALAPRIGSGCPVPADCELYYISRDTLFSFNKKSEEFLQRLVALFVSSHYKNTPDDLLLMSDAPAHHLYVLLGPVDPKSKELPEILCAVQLGLEGEISKGAAAAALRQGQRATGDLIPWTVSQQFQDPEFASLSGGRIVRIATHPDYQRMGYGRRALDLLQQYFEGRLASTEEALPEPTVARSDPADMDADGTLQSEKLAPRANLPPLLTPLQFRPAEALHYLGTSFGVTPELFKFWRGANYRPLYLRQTANAVTGEHSCIMVQPLESLNPDVTCRPDWAEAYSFDFVRRFASLSAYDFSVTFAFAYGPDVPLLTGAVPARSHTGHAGADAASQCPDSGPLLLAARHRPPRQLHPEHAGLPRDHRLAPGLRPDLLPLQLRHRDFARAAGHSRGFGSAAPQRRVGRGGPAPAAHASARPLYEVHEEVCEPLQRPPHRYRRGGYGPQQRRTEGQAHPRRAGAGRQQAGGGQRSCGN
jgi:ribosomal protein S18 acetylase RimI-like enzyme